MESMTFPILLIAIFFLGVALIWAIKEEEPEIATGIVVIAVSMLSLYAITFDDEDTEKNVIKGEYYSTQCQLIEINIDNGVFLLNTNKLKCGDVIENVTVDDYQKYIEAYKKSQTNH
ncbi:hypothetical protein EC835_11422 [Providencia alcalifaciens]|uniref:Uncharacterized protein n=1 Tax=Providencia alcalifaciens TaxID=126385 RepID=A0A4R3NF46_9GAMM|nr:MULTISPECIES: hypothetical protein [Providencia]MBC5792309.1 hypothetical protein [Providencia sp. JUb39]TCT28891.1 hypothetical protein EC835_11422 [Providencia alcalifaciens]